MLPLPTTTVTLRGPTFDVDPYEVGASTPNVAELGDDVGLYDDDLSIYGADGVSGVPPHIGTPPGRGSTSRSEVDAQLYLDVTPAIVPATIVVDETTEVEWVVRWVDRRQGLGLDHQTAGLVRIGGADG
jgi:hypothetical protein